MSPIIRTALESDINGILALQAENLYANLAPTALSNGFVTTPFRPDLLQYLLHQTGVFVAEDEDKIVGYLLAGDWKFFSRWEIFLFMLDRLPSLTFQGRSIPVEDSFQYGPICLDRSVRGTTVFPDIFAYMRSSFAPKYPIGITFINKLNQRSFAAHTRKLDLEIIDEFELNDNSFYTLAFSTRS
jgi:hypothetical protein